MKRKLVVAALALTLAGTFPAQAHHSAAMFDGQKTTTLAGTVRQFQWANPHCFIQLIVKNEQGRDEEWSLEMTAPIHLQRLGWKRTSLRPGDRITVKIHPLRSGQNGGNVLEALGPDGKPIGRQA
jgi:hypothetical protein